MRSEKSGFILIQKPSGITSHDVVDELRKITGVKKIGHAGTLDPFATGLLILGIDKRATKRLSWFFKLDKEYIAKIKLGAVSDTYDRDGKIVIREFAKSPLEKKIKNILKSFEGRIEQYPPIFSAKKVKGRKLYEFARKGIKIKIKPQEVEIHKIELLSYSFPFLEIKVHCSSGTYIRSLAYDIGERLGCGGYLEELCRTRIGNFELKEAVDLSKISSQNWQNFLFDNKDKIISL